MDKKILMIIGAGVEQIPAYIKAKERGFAILASDMSSDAPGVKYADYFIKCSTRDPDLTAEMAQKFSEKNKITGVMTIANDVPLTVATVAKKLGLKSISVEAAQAASNKLLMKDLFTKFNVACPWYSIVNDGDHLREIHKKMDYIDLVVKPIDGRGARGVLLIDKNTDYNWVFEESKKWGDSGIVMVEEFIPGIQLSTESFILDGKIYTPAMAERNYSRLNEFRPNIIEDGGTIPAPIDKEVEKKINELVLNGARAMGITEGIVKGDIVIDENNEPMIIELAARLSGGWFATHQIPEATGVDLVNAVISYSMQIKINTDSLIPTHERSTSIRYWFPEEGKILNITGEDTLKKLPFVMSYGFFRKIGDMQPKVKMHPDRFGFVIVSGKNRDESILNVQTALDSTCILVSRD